MGKYLYDGQLSPPLTTVLTGLGVALWVCPKKNLALYDKLETLMSSLNTVFPGLPPRFPPHVTITSNLAVDLDNPKDDVDRILSLCSIALSKLPGGSSGGNYGNTGSSGGDQGWIRLGSVASNRGYFQKLFFRILPDATLMSFARIVRELFVILPEKTEREHQLKNPHLFHKDHEGRLVRRRKKTSEPIGEIDLPRIRNEAALDAANWCASDYKPHLSLVYSDLYPIDTALWHTVRSRVLDYLSIDTCDSPNWDDVGNGLSWLGGLLQLVLCEGDVSDWVVLGSVDL